MPKHTDDLEMEQRHFAIAAARLRSEGLNQLQIARRLRKSQPEISRMLDYAEKHGFLARAPAFLSQNITPAELMEVERRFFLDEELRDALSALAPHGLHLNVQVLPVGDNDFARAAAGCAARLLLRASLVGVMWGRTMRRLVRHIGEQREFFDEAGGCEAQCIPLCGDPVHLMNQRLVQYSASHLAAELSQAIKPGRNPDQPSELGPCLVGVPAYMSRQLFAKRGGMAATREEFVREIPGYRAIFGPTGDRDPPLVDCVDTILTGMGIIVPDSHQATPAPSADPTAAHEDTGDFIKERLAQEGMAPGILMRLVYGDIGGWLLEKQGLREARQLLVESLNQGWTGVTGEHFARVARNAKPNGIPGVILVAAGPLKAKMLRELVRRGFVNELLIDTSLATAIKLLV